ncbi:MAG TPA: CYTH domain-containing protein [Bacteroidales bacterium]|jgi:CYTH domain-containing protein|nr:CYTH domain-containing protein [Bacteroidales bacterium]HNZ42927.1 CYTH domain-containing protein [Bacteroidales bacterium]HPI29747.1 CYTH domain-containing protein [Bacteroidales bacterium]HQP14562.1 CYTH domain-containing protein [Bacteroidales bacterium]
MPNEIEHKFLVNKGLWAGVSPEKTVFIRQVYLLTEPEISIRIRTKDNEGFITIKGKSQGPVRREYEYPIPLKDANELIEKSSATLIEKKRHIVYYKNMKWEVDEFLGTNSGLILCEIELESEDQQYEKPEWIDKEVTDDMRYYNSVLSVNPYSKW